VDGTRTAIGAGGLSRQASYVEQDTRRSLGFVGWVVAAVYCQSIAEGALALTQPELALAGAPRGTNI
jgi:hypothetical protein